MRKRRRRPPPMRDLPGWSCDCESCQSEETIAAVKGLGARFVQHQKSKPKTQEES